MPAETTSRGRPRDARSHAAILAAAADLVTETGYAAMSLGAVATRARVGKDTIYRRWSGKAELVYEAVFTTTDTAPVPDTGTLESDLTVLVQQLIDEFSAPPAAAALPGLLADFAAAPQLRARIRSAFLAPAKQRLASVFERAQARGEMGLSVETDLVLDALVGTVFFRMGILGEPASLQLARSVARIAAKGIEPR
ncbi:TetR/AcrR family transcriptional regulator [Streptomyces wuyuanensis]|uniref:DNA-binding transcriptional regulator, AcrR family n=1 Tax=Streptomyces wuyuanensis TaxID=1196353 RepID=A0A1H0B405_9ACTN|nr:TetR/AcrR family transcriptional regulator [Streptomyces wuyuanensis]SDN40400.1 DNA-binding transcriptional regulator, AcrR family [Streptomyces wuyuanensis]